MSSVNQTISIYIDQASAERALAKLQADATRLTTSIANGQAAGRNMTAEMERLGRTNTAIDTLTRQIDGRMAPSLRQVEQAAGRLRRELSQMSTDAPGYAAAFDRFQRVNTRLQQMRSELNGINNAMSQNKGSSFFSAIMQGLGLGAGLSVVRLLTSLVSMLKNLATGSFDAAAKMEQLTVSFTTMLGSGERAKKLLADIQAFAARTPFNSSDVAQYAKQLLAFGVDALKIIPTMQMLGDVAAGVGIDKLPNLVLAFGQIRSTGRLMGQDLNQLINAGFNPLQIISEKTGRSVASLKKDMEKGLISFADVEGAFKSATSEGGKFFNLMQNQSRTASGAIANLGDAWDQFKTKLGAKFLEGVGTAARSLTEYVQGLIPDTATEKFDKLTDSVARLQMNILPLADRYDVLKAKTTLTKNEQDELKTIINQLAEAVPGAITQFDQYGKALDVNTNSVRLFIEVERDRLKVVNAAAIDENQNALNKIIQDRKKLIPQLNEIKATAAKGGLGTFTMSLTAVDESGNSRDITRQATQAEVAALIEKNRDLLAKQRGYLAEVERLNGDALHKRMLEIDEEAKALAEAGKAGVTEQTDAEKAKIKAAEEGAAALSQKLLDKKDELTAALRDKDQGELERIHNEYAKYLKEAEKYNRILKRNAVDESEIRSAETAAIDKKMAEQNQRRLEKTYQDKLLSNREFYNKEKEEAANDFLNGIDTREEYEARIREIIIDENNEKLAIAKRFAPSVTQAARDEQTAITANLEKEVANRIAIAQAEKKRREDIADNDMAGLQANVINAPDNSKALFDAKKAALLAQADYEEKHWKEKGQKEYKNEAFYQNQIALLHARTNKSMEALDKERMQVTVSAIQETVSSLANVLGGLFAMQQQQTQNQLEALSAAGNKQKTTLDNQLSSGYISQVNYNKRVQELQKMQAQKEYELKTKQFKADQAAALVQVGISAAMGIASIWSKYAWAPPIAIGLTAIEGIAIATQIAAIQAKKPPAAPTYAKGRKPRRRGGMPAGASHANGGIDLIDNVTGDTVGEMEGDEPILSVKTYENNREIVDALLDASMNNNGASIKNTVTSLSRNAMAIPVPINTARAETAIQNNRTYSTGRTATTGTTASNQVGFAMPADMLEAMMSFTRQLQQGVKADVYFNEFDKKQQEINAIKNRNKLK